MKMCHVWHSWNESFNRRGSGYHRTPLGPASVCLTLIMAHANECAALKTGGACPAECRGVACQCCARGCDLGESCVSVCSWHVFSQISSNTQQLMHSLSEWAWMQKCVWVVAYLCTTRLNYQDFYFHIALIVQTLFVIIISFITTKL